MADHLSLGEGARIGHFNVIRGCESVTIGDHGGIGTLNWITAHPQGDARHYAGQADRHPVLKIGRHSSITTRHYLDCTAGIVVGDFSTVAGLRSQILTHSIDLDQNLQTAKGITIGAYSFIGTATVLLQGSSLPDFSVLAAGSVLTKPQSEPYSLYAGQPAVKIRELPRDMGYFGRERGYVS
jgi:acetyltransferase-like isoleucine patch superfamily enzyme